MITKIKLNDVASYKNPALLETDKKVNLIYGLNGAGKSIFSNYLYLYKKNHADFLNCTTEGLNEEEIIVYNQQFIKDCFYESDSIQGVFTLSKENKEAEEKIKNANNKIEKLNEETSDENKKINDIETNFLETKKNTEKKVWKIKKDFADDDKVLEFCLDSLKSKKKKIIKSPCGC